MSELRFVPWSLSVLLLGVGCASSPPAVPAAAIPVATAPRALTVAEIAARALPAVVTIRTAQSLGTGFVVRADGWIATNLHVIVGGPQVEVTLRDGRVLEVADVLAVSAKHDLVLLRIEAGGLQTVPLGDSDSMRPGDPVVAIGNPLGLEDTVSNGLISARRAMSDFEVLQVSAPIAPGSSGGPLLNERGEVIGIATAVLQGGQNLNFGVPIRYLATMLRRTAPMPLAEFAAAFAHSHQPALPKYERAVPHHALAVLDGCTTEAERIIVRALAEAIEAGAPLYNEGRAEACYHMYDGAASDLVRKLPASCKGPAKALVEGQRKAASLSEPGAQAWAMRDAFDGLLDVITRKHGE